MKRDFYTTPKSGYLMRLLWSASGGDKYILERATYSDQVKYMCLGGIIVATGAMAALAGGYAFYTIFEPRGSAIEHDFNLTTAIISIIFGCFWGLMIFNLDRFIVSSTGKGDGTEAITWDELKGASPRIFMGIIIALTISKPVEIRMFKSEIDAALHEEQLTLRRDYEIRTRANYEGRLKLIDAELSKFEIEKNTLKARISKSEEELTNQLQGRAGAPAGNGKLSEALRDIKDKLEDNLINFDHNNQNRIDKLMLARDGLIHEMDIELGKNEIVANGLDGLLERIKLAHKIAGFWISLFITLLFMAIELTPIFFKLMLVKSPYDYLKENVEELMKAEQGIHIEYNYHKDKEGQERDLITHIEVEKLLTDKRAMQKVQEELSAFAILQYKEEMEKRIKANPHDFIKMQEIISNKMNLKKRLCTLSGDDFNIIRECNKYLKYRFAAIGLFVFFIFILCFVSCYFTFTMLFQNIYIGIPVSLFFSWMITNIYLLLLYTLSKNILPQYKLTRSRFFSLGIRIGFICFIGVFISKPLEVLLFSDQLKKEISNYKIKQVKKYTEITSEYFNKQIQNLKSNLSKKKLLQSNSLNDPIYEYNNSLNLINSQKKELIIKMKELVNNSNYYIQSIIIMNSNYRLCWLYTFLCIVIFLLPAYLKSILKEQSNFYNIKRELETNLIQKEYNSFKEKYKDFFQTDYTYNITYCELYIDSPFNTKRKFDKRVFKNETDLNTELYNG